MLKEDLEAERDFLITPGRRPDQILKKVEVLDSILFAEQNMGPRNYPVVSLALGAIKADILSLKREAP